MDDFSSVSMYDGLNQTPFATHNPKVIAYAPR